MNKATYQSQLRRTYKAFKEKPKTMLQVARETGIMRPNICRYVADLKKRNKITVIKKDICPISKHKAAFYSTDPKLIPEPGQAEMFPKKHAGAYSR